MKVHMEGEEALERLTPFLFVGNNRYRTAGFEMGAQPRLDSGRLWICTAPTKRHRNVVHVALKILMGRENDLELNSFEAEELRVEPGAARVYVSADGEVSVMNTSLHYRIRPHALGVIVPRRGASRDDNNTTRGFIRPQGSAVGPDPIGEEWL